ncbi:unnamed protein product [Ectocarpus sp. 13 AM-2016]
MWVVCRSKHSYIWAYERNQVAWLALCRIHVCCWKDGREEQRPRLPHDINRNRLWHAPRAHHLPSLRHHVRCIAKYINSIPLLSIGAYGRAFEFLHLRRGRKCDVTRTARAQPCILRLPEVQRATSIYEVFSSSLISRHAPWDARVQCTHRSALVLIMLLCILKTVHVVTLKKTTREDIL